MLYNLMCVDVHIKISMVVFTSVLGFFPLSGSIFSLVNINEKAEYQTQMQHTDSGSIVGNDLHCKKNLAEISNRTKWCLLSSGYGGRGLGHAAEWGKQMIL